jgi:hypothetical protein
MTLYPIANRRPRATSASQRQGYTEFTENTSVGNENFLKSVTRLRKIASKIAINVLCVSTAVITIASRSAHP